MAVEEILQVQVRDGKNLREVDRTNRCRGGLMIDKGILPETAPRSKPCQFYRRDPCTSLGQVDLDFTCEDDVQASQPFALVDDDFPGSKTPGFAGLEKHLADGFRYFFKYRGLCELEIAHYVYFCGLQVFYRKGPGLETPAIVPATLYVST